MLPLTGLTIRGFSLGYVLYVITQFLSNRSHYVVVDDCWSKLANVVPGVPRGSVVGQLLFLLRTADAISLLWKISFTVALTTPL